jgi:hypothetical protein
MWIFATFACQQSDVTYNRRSAAAGAATDQSDRSRFDDDSSFDPNDPCGTEKAFGYQYGQNSSRSAQKTFIVGGDAASQDDLVTRSTVKIHLGNGHCTGTLIGLNQVVTAAHCFQEITSASQISLGFGGSGSVDPGLRVTGAMRHPSYQGILGTEENGYLDVTFYDVAVITFEGTIDDQYYPVVVGSTEDEVSSGTEVIVAGYGAYSEQDNLLRPLTQVNTTVDEVLTDLREIQLTGGEGKGACYGDSGGPTYVFDQTQSCLKVVGTTTGPGRNSNYTCNYGSGTMMDITTYKGWIKCALEDLGSPLGYLDSDSSEQACQNNEAIF